ncbi:inhibitor of apoptosis-promoting Bax1-domain-containing protein [Phycomyces nitens]|nr:inhibitor of apoptosis-promoting Bax1-domain-containing protein [Phycomyces nitens]
MNPSSSKHQQNFSSETTISRPVRSHLLRVYLTIAGMLVLAASGSYMNVMGMSNSTLMAVSNSPLSFTIVLGSILGIRHPSTNSVVRWVLLGLYALFSGMSLARLIEVFTFWDPSGGLLTAALSSAVFIFLGFSASALLAERRSMIYVGGVVSGILGIVFWTSLANLFFGNSMMFSAELYLGLIAFCGYVIYDTQMIVEHASAGNFNVPLHALELFMDLFALFTRLSTIFLEKDKKKEKKRRVQSFDR